MHKIKVSREDLGNTMIIALVKNLLFFANNNSSKNILRILYYCKRSGMTFSFTVRSKINRFSVCDLDPWIGVNARVVVAPFARRHLWGICAVVSVGSQYVVARFARTHLWSICAAVSVGSQCVVARFA